MTQADLILSHFTLLHFFFRLKRCDNPASSTSMGTIFPRAFAHFVSLCHVLVVLTVFPIFSLLLYLFWWSVISDVITVIVWGCHELYLHKTANWTDKCFFLTLPLINHPLVSLPLLRPPYSLRHNYIEIRPINNSMAFKCSSERRAASLPL